MRCLASLALVWLVAPGFGAEPKPLEFKLTFDKAACAEPFTGRVFVTFRSDPAAPPGLNWFKPEPGLARDVKSWEPGSPLFVGARDVAYPAPLANLKPGKYYVCAVLDRDLGGSSSLGAAGNVFSRPVQVDLDPNTSGTVELKLDQVVAPREFKEAPEVKLLEIESRLLTQFAGKPARLRGGVVLPPSFAKEPNRRYPVVYEVPGFGGNHFGAFARATGKRLRSTPFRLHDLRWT